MPLTASSTGTGKMPSSGLDKYAGSIPAPEPMSSECWIVVNQFQMKINFNRWGKTYHTPHLCLIINEDDYGIHFAVLNYHWWVSIKRKK